jgi:hypothetical protein
MAWLRFRRDQNEIIDYTEDGQLTKTTVVYKVKSLGFGMWWRESKLHSWWEKIQQHPFIVMIIFVMLFAPIAFTFAAYNHAWSWTGFLTKTLWDWLNLLGVLAIPVVVGLGAAWYTAQQRKVRDRENTDNQREDALQGYIDKMSELLLEKQLCKSAEEDEVRKIAQVRTVTVLCQLDGKRVGYVFSFLHKVGLTEAPKPIISLSQANFTRVNWSQADLYQANLYQAFLYQANLTYANLFRANLLGVNLLGANLSHAFLHKADLSKAELRQANFYRADLLEANLRGANLSKADLREARLIGAELSDADLSGAKIAQEQLEQAKSLKGATMPDGSIHS